MTWLIGGIVYVLVAGVFVMSLCKVAGDADEAAGYK